jgi:peptidoglycan/xylan/chitin deacetylase (PgdA/CDA1 family)
MRIRGVGRLVNGTRWLRSRFSPRVPILLYHRVADPHTDPQLLSVAPRNFADHLEILNKYFWPISMQQLISALENEKIPDRAVAVTFDDGYADNLYQAKPLLKRHNIPAIIFVTSGYLGKNRTFWWDELERLLLHPGILPETLKIDRVNGNFEWNLVEAVQYDPEQWTSFRFWSVLDKDFPTSRQRLYRELCQILASLPWLERDKILEKLRAWAGSRQPGPSTHPVLSQDELRQIVKEGLIAVGAHTVSHPILSNLPLSKQEWEIRESKACLEEILGGPVVGFSYPYGSRADYTEDTVRLVQRAGFSWACSNYARPVCNFTNKWQLPRFLVRNWEGEEFLRHLSEWVA